ncbi:MAG TPA: TonB-dependent receptor [Acidobacteriaceae bacterium]|nr:TonB-dependent receptor [Acidobacteriaceae bacterium]
MSSKGFVFRSLAVTVVFPLMMTSMSVCLGAPIPTVRPIQEQELKSMSLEQLGNVEVTTASKQPEEVWKTPAAVSVITSDDIRQSGATTLPELLRMVPGVQVSRMQSDAWAVGIRGFASQFSKGLLVMIDGRSVYTPLFEGVYWDVQDLPLDDIDRIEVIRGPAGAVWGENAVNGVINIITKHARDTRGTHASALGGGAVDRFIGEAQQSWNLHNHWQARAYAKGFTRGPELDPGNDPYDAWHEERGGFRADWQANHRDTLMIEGDVYQGEVGGQNAIGTFFPPAQIVVQGAQPVSGGDLVLRWDRTLSAKSDFYLEAYFDRTNRKSLQFDETRDTFDVDFVDHIGYLPRQDIVFGAGLRESPSNLIQTHASVNFSPNQLTDYIYSGFLQDRIEILPNRLAAILGTKIEDNNYSGVGVEPNARILWNPTAHQAIWGAVSRVLRVPGRVDQDLTLIGNYAASPPVFVRILGNPKFKPEVTIGWEAGYRQLLTPRLYVDLSLFHNQYDDLESYGEPIFSVSFPTQPYPYTALNVTFENGVKGVTDGLELAPDWKPFSWLDLRGTYSHLHMALHSKAGFNQASYVASYQGTAPDHIATIQSLLTLPYGIEIDPDYRYMSALPAQDAPGYQTADAHVAWKIRKHFQLTVDGRNLLQPSHREFLGDNSNRVGIKREVYGGIAWIP